MGLALGIAASLVQAASHREAPLIALDPAADITDVYAFVSYDAANLARQPADRKVTLIMNVIPGQEPSSGPNYFSFDDNVLYEIKVDNDRDGQASDVIYQFRFQTETRTPDQFIATLGGGPLPPVSAIDGPGQRGPVAGPALHRDRAARMQGALERSAVRVADGPLRRPAPAHGALEHRPAHDAELRQPAAAGHPHRRRHRHPRLRRPERRDLRHRPGRRVRHAQPARRERHADSRWRGRRCRCRPRPRTPTTS